MIKGTGSFSAGGVASRYKMDPKGRSIPVHNEKMLFLQCHIVALFVKAFLVFLGFILREKAI
jgi:hypothetical protein